MPRDTLSLGLRGHDNRVRAHGCRTPTAKRAQEGALRRRRRPRPGSSIAAAVHGFASSSARHWTQALPVPAPGASSRARATRSPRPRAPAARSRRRENRRVVLAVANLPNPRIDVAADRAQIEIRPQRTELRYAAEAARARRPRRREALPSSSPSRATRQSRASSRRQTAPTMTPAVSSVGRSLSECTARSISPARSARSSSLP